MTANARSALGVADRLHAGRGWPPRASRTCSAAAPAARPGCCASAPLVYLAAMALALPAARRRGHPAGQDGRGSPAASPPKPGAPGRTTRARPGTRAGADAAHDGPQPGEDRPGPDGTRPAAAGRSRGRTGLRRLFTLPTSGRSSREAMRANATLRAFSGFMIFFLAFLLRTVHFPGASDKVALGEMIARRRARRVHRHRHRRRAAVPRAAGHRVRHARPGHGDHGALRGVLRAVGRAGRRAGRRARPGAGQAGPGLDRAAARSARRSGRPRSPSPRRCTSCPGWPAAWPGWLMSLTNSGVAGLAVARRARAGAGRWCSRCRSWPGRRRRSRRRRQRGRAPPGAPPSVRDRPGRSGRGRRGLRPRCRRPRRAARPRSSWRPGCPGACRAGRCSTPRRAA